MTRKEKTAELVVRRGGQGPRRWKEGAGPGAAPGPTHVSLQVSQETLALEEARPTAGAEVLYESLTGRGESRGHADPPGLVLSGTRSRTLTPRFPPELRLWPLGHEEGKGGGSCPKGTAEQLQGLWLASPTSRRPGTQVC